MAPGAKHRNAGFAVQAPPCPATQLETAAACWPCLWCLSFPAVRGDSRAPANPRATLKSTAQCLGFPQNFPHSCPDVLLRLFTACTAWKSRGCDATFAVERKPCEFWAFPLAGTGTAQTCQKSYRYPEGRRKGRI